MLAKMRLEQLLRNPFDFAFRIQNYQFFPLGNPLHGRTHYVVVVVMVEEVPSFKSSLVDEPLGVVVVDTERLVLVSQSALAEVVVDDGVVGHVHEIGHQVVDVLQRVECHLIVDVKELPE